MHPTGQFIIITGSLTSGKSTLCKKLSDSLSKYWDIDGVLSFTNKRKQHSKEKATEYNLYSIHQKKTFPWAIRKNPQEQFTFLEDNAQIITDEILRCHNHKEKDVIILDNLGFHEMNQKGFYPLLTSIDSNKTQMIISVQKDMLEPFVNAFHFNDPIIVDLDITSPIEAYELIIAHLKKKDAELIGTYASITTIMELGLGSTLNAFRVPLKGVFLAGLQNFMLILFGKSLKGRGLLSIVTITAGLKSFSLAGGKFRPMFYIFFQGFFFILPTMILGFNLISVIIGSILLNISTFFLGIFINAIVFGMSYVYANINAINQILNYFHFDSLSFLNIIIFVLVFKSTVGFLIGVITYFANFHFIINKMGNKISHYTSHSSEMVHQKSTWRKSFKDGIFDLLNLKFLTSLIFLSLVIYFFAKLNTNDFILVVIRAIIISWFGFVLARRIDFISLVAFLNKKNYPYLAGALQKAFEVVTSFKNSKAKTSSK